MTRPLGTARTIRPPVVARDIRKTLKAGIDFNAIYVADEIPTNSVLPGQEVPLDLMMPPPPQRLLRRIAWIEHMDWLVEWDLEHNSWSAGRCNNGRRYCHVSLERGDCLGHPILFGVNFEPWDTHDGDPIGMWYYLTHWDWSQQRGSFLAYRIGGCDVR